MKKLIFAIAAVALIGMLLMSTAASIPGTAAREAKRAPLDEVTQPSSAVFARGDRYAALKAKQLERGDPEPSLAVNAPTRQERYEALKQKQLEQAEAKNAALPSALPAWRQRYEVLKAKQLEQAEAR